MSDPTVSIIICTRNRADSLRATLESLGRMRVPEDMPAELLVVDNGSTDHTKEVIEQTQLTNMPVRHLLEPCKGQCHARNRGIAESKGDILLWTDDDCRVPEDWIEEMCRPILNGQADAVAGGVRLAPELERAWMTQWHKSWLACTDRLDPHSPEDMVGANMAFSRMILGRIGGFDPSLGPGALGFCDDTLFSSQLRQAGFRLVGRLDVRVEHNPGASRLSRRNFLRMAEAFGRSFAYVSYHWEHKDCPNAARNLPRALVRLWLERCRNHADVRRREGAAPWELSRLQEIAYYRQFLRESKGPRLYEPFGLVKRNGG